MRPCLPLLLAALPLLSCGPPTCPPVKVLAPDAPEALPWTSTGNAGVDAELAGTSVQAVLDTGFPQSSIAPAAAGGLELSRVTVRLGGAAAGPMPFGLLLTPGLDVAAVLGGDLLHQLPFALDARARTVQLLPSFAPEPAPTSTPLDVWITGRCRDDRPENGPEGPHALLVDATLDGQALRLLLDTGAAATFVRTSVVAALDPRPRLEGVRVETGFAGPFVATATRARALSIGGASSANSLVLTGSPVDDELDRLLSRYGGRRCAGGTGCPDRLDGFLGWSFLREFQVGLAEGQSPTRGRALALSRFSTQDHWTREFVGIGVYTTPSADPTGERIEGFLSVSPGQQAGLLVGDVILTVDGVPASSAPSPWAPAGTTVDVQLARGSALLTVPVQVMDLLPDPP